MNRPWAKLIFFVFILYFIQIFNPNSWNPNQSLRLSTKLAANIIKKFEFDMIFVVRFKSDQHRCLNLDGLESESLTIRFRKPNSLSLLSKCWCFWLFWSILSFLSFFQSNEFLIVFTKSYLITKFLRTKKKSKLLFARKFCRIFDMQHCVSVQFWHTAIHKEVVGKVQTLELTTALQM